MNKIPTKNKQTDFSKFYSGCKENKIQKMKRKQINRIKIYYVLSKLGNKTIRILFHI